LTKVGDTQQIAAQLFGSWVWPFELLSLLLLVALVAALALSRMPTPPATSTEGETQ
jgi:NADH:ubiquinone oxidoreductase subunit 6 (subunit J)